MLTLRPNNFDLFYNSLINELESSGIKSSLKKTHTHSTSFDLVKEKEHVVFQTIATGLSEKDIVMSIENKKLYVKGKPSEKTKLNSLFEFKIDVGDVQASDTTAELSQGILTIRMPIKEDKKSVSINF